MTGTRGQSHERRTIPSLHWQGSEAFPTNDLGHVEGLRTGLEMEFMVNDSMAHLNNPRLNGEINRFRGKSELVQTLEKMLHDLQGQVTEVQGQLVRTYDKLGMCKQRLERADVYGELYRLNRRRYPSQRVSRVGPLLPRVGGPVEMPILADDIPGPIRHQKAWRTNQKRKKPHCYTCKKRGHLSYKCPTRQVEEGEVTQESMREERMKLLNRIDWTPSCCIKCGSRTPDTRHWSAQSMSSAAGCGGSGAYMYLRRHECRPIIDEDEVLLHDDTDYDLYWNVNE